MEAAGKDPCNTSNRFSTLSSSFVYEIDHNSSHFHIPVILYGRNKSKEVIAMVDCGATDTFLSSRFVSKNKVKTRKLDKPVPILNIDGSPNVHGSITEVAVLRMDIGSHSEKVVFPITDVGTEDVVIGLDWLRKHNPDIDWEHGSLRLSRCPADCKAKKSTLDAFSALSSDTEVRLTARQRGRKNKKSQPGEVKSRVTIEEVEDEDATSESPFDPEWKDFDTDAAIFATSTFSQRLAEEALKGKEKRSVEETVPKHYHDFLSVFSEAASERLPEPKPYDHAIDLEPEAKPFHSRVYPLSPGEQVELDKFLEENLAKGYIRPSKSPMSSPFFFVKKKDGSFRPTQDYRRLNNITRKNRYPLPLVSTIMDKLKGARYFTKLEVRKGYNNVRI